MIEITSRLPAEYQEVEHIQSSGTQCINTAYKPTSENFKVVYDFEYPSSDTTGSLFGSATPGGPYSIVAYNALSFYVGTSGALLPQTVTIQTRYSLAAQAKNNVLSVSLNGNTQTAVYNGSIFKTYPLHLFSSSNLGSAYQFCSIKLYACQIYDNDILVRDYVPCYRKADNAVGMYDLVNGVFYTNAGSGAFAKGENVGETIITKGGVITKKWALRRRNMLFQLSGEFAFEYTGDYTDNRDANGVGTVKFTSSGTLTILSGSVTVNATIRGAGGGGFKQNGSVNRNFGGGGGGVQTIQVTLKVGSYNIVIGKGGASKTVAVSSYGSASAGGDTIAFGKTSTGGKGGYFTSVNVYGAGNGGSPNGNNGSGTTGGSPNGGNSGSNGSDGYVELTFEEAA